jgi:hypothetical protein
MNIHERPTTMLAVVLLVLATLCPGIARAATQRPLADFLGAQGTTAVFFPPAPDYLGWANNSSLVSSAGPSLQCRFALIDYAGLAAGFLASNGGPLLGTTVSGSVTERPLADGRAEVTVVLHTHNALAFAQTCANFGPGNPDAFGSQAAELIANPSLQPGLADAEFGVVFINTAPGAPLPDIGWINSCLACLPAGFELVSLDFRATGFGPLHPSSGFPEGTPGQLVVTETAIFRAQPGGRVALDGFPAERVDWRPAGH